MQEATKLSATIIVPAYNEAGAIEDVLEHIKNVMDSSELSYEILVVDDGSTDDTALVVQKKGIKVISSPQNQGYGAALKSGIRHAKYDVIVITDADGTYPNDKIPELLRWIGKYDMVVGARIGKDVHIPWLRKPAKWFIGGLANLMAGAEIQDLNSGLRAFRASLAKRFYPILPNGFSFTSTITLAMFENGYTVKYIPIDYHKRIGKSKINPIRDTLNFTLLIIRTTVYYAPLRVFLPISGVLLLAGLIFGVYSILILEKLMDVTTVVLVMAAIQLASTGLLADMINKRTPRF
jgi:glycosyltransferase involved in cell wall biosynthesis